MGNPIQDRKTWDFQIQIHLFEQRAPDHGPSASGPNSPALEKPLVFSCELLCDQICLWFVCRVNQQWQYRIACRKLKSAEVTALQCYLERSALLQHADDKGISAKQLCEDQTQTLTYLTSLYHLQKQIFRRSLSSNPNTDIPYIIISSTETDIQKKSELKPKHWHTLHHYIIYRNRYSEEVWAQTQTLTYLTSLYHLQKQIFRRSLSSNPNTDIPYIIISSTETDIQKKSELKPKHWHTLHHYIIYRNRYSEEVWAQTQTLTYLTSLYHLQKQIFRRSLSSNPNTDIPYIIISSTETDIQKKSELKPKHWHTLHHYIIYRNRYSEEVWAQTQTLTYLTSLYHLQKQIFRRSLSSNPNTDIPYIIISSTETDIQKKSELKPKHWHTLHHYIIYRNRYSEEVWAQTQTLTYLTSLYHLQKQIFRRSLSSNPNTDIPYIIISSTETDIQKKSKLKPKHWHTLHHYIIYRNRYSEEVWSQTQTLTYLTSLYHLQKQIFRRSLSSNPNTDTPYIIISSTETDIQKKSELKPKHWHTLHHYIIYRNRYSEEV